MRKILEFIMIGGNLKRPFGMSNEIIIQIEISTEFIDWFEADRSR